MATIGPPVVVAEFEEEKKPCCGRLTYRGASLIVGVMEIFYWFYYILLLIFACINHREAWSIVILSVNLFILTIQVIIVMVAVIKRRPKLLQSHLVFLCLTLVFDLFMTCGFFAMAVFPNALAGKLVNYKGVDWNARVFGLVMGSLLIVWFIGRFVTTIILYRYWKILRVAEERAKEIPLTSTQKVHFREETLMERTIASLTPV